MTYVSRRAAPLLLLLLAACPGDPDTSTGSEASSAAASDTDLSQSNTSDPTGTGTGTAAATGTDASTGDPPTTGSPDTSDTGTSPDLPPGVECVTDEDCQLIDNCCDCAGAPLGEEPPPCRNPCAATRCDDDFGIEVGAACRNGVCALAAGSCAGSPACGEPPPDCNAGTIPAGSGDCWGECQAPNTCGGSNCDGDDPNSCGVGWVCVESQSQGAFCEPVPLACGGVPTCDCVYAETAGMCLGACSDDGNGKLLCEDGG